MNLSGCYLLSLFIMFLHASYNVYLLFYHCRNWLTWDRILQDANGGLMREDDEKADLLNQFFSSVFTSENTSHVLQTTWHFEGVKIKDIIISTDCTRHKLRRLKVTGSPGPDGIPSRVLLETAECKLYRSPSEHAVPAVTQ